jgi:hypothetical protein
MKRDLADFVTWGAAAALAVSLVILLARPAGEKVAAPGPAVETAAEADQEALALEKELGHYPPVPADRQTLEAYAGRHPGQSRPLIFLGSFDLEGGNLRGAVEHLKKALEMERGYADAKSALYQGPLLKKVVDEGLRVYLREKEMRPGDKDVERIIKDLYFMKRSMAGGCD